MVICYSGPKTLTHSVSLLCGSWCSSFVLEAVRICYNHSTEDNVADASPPAALVTEMGTHATICWHQWREHHTRTKAWGLLTHISTTEKEHDYSMLSKYRFPWSGMPTPATYSYTQDLRGTHVSCDHVSQMTTCTINWEQCIVSWSLYDSSFHFS